MDSSKTMIDEEELETLLEELASMNREHIHQLEDAKNHLVARVEVLSEKATGQCKELQGVAFMCLEVAETLVNGCMRCAVLRAVSFGSVVRCSACLVAHQKLRRVHDVVCSIDSSRDS